MAGSKIRASVAGRAEDDDSEVAIRLDSGKSSNLNLRLPLRLPL